MGGLGNDIFVFAKGQAQGDSITDFKGNGASAGDSIRLTGWGAGTTFTKAADPNVWVIKDGVDGEMARIWVSSTVHASDVTFG